MEQSISKAMMYQTDWRMAARMTTASKKTCLKIMIIIKMIRGKKISIMRSCNHHSFTMMMQLENKFNMMAIKMHSYLNKIRN